MDMRALKNKTVNLAFVPMICAQWVTGQINPPPNNQIDDNTLVFASNGEA
jgi:hypothetical protein